MAKNPSKKSKPVNREDPMNGAMKFFLAGLVAELYLLIIRRFYVNGTAVQMITWYDYLFYFSIAGLVILAAGAVLSAVWRKEQKKRHIGWYIAGAGAFLALASFLIWKLNTPALTFLSVLVPVVMLLGILWNLYDRECAYALTILGISLVAGLPPGTFQPVSGYLCEGIRGRVYPVAGACCRCGPEGRQRRR